MKTRIKPITLLILSILINTGNVSALSNSDRTNDILTVFQKDGQMTMLLKSEIEKMQLSDIDLEGKAQSTFVTQEILTTDSLYRFNIEDIDSISLHPQPNILKDGVIDIEKYKEYSDGEYRLLDYVYGADRSMNNLYVYSSTPESIIPQKGDIMVCNKFEYPLPIGFLGEVEEIIPMGDYYNIKCNNIDLDDAYVTYCNVTEFEVGSSAPWYNDTIPNNFKFQQSRSDLDISNMPNVFWGQEYNLPQFKGNLKFEEGHGEPDINFEFCKNSGISLDANLGSKIKGHIFKQLSLSQGLYTSITLLSTHTLDIGLGVEGDFDKEFEREICNTPDIVIPGLGLMTLDFSGGFKIGIKGSIGIKGQLTKEFQVLSHISLSPFNLKGAPTKSQLKFISQSDIVNSLSGYGKAELTAGPYISVNLNFINKALAKGSISFEAGVSAEISANLDTYSLLNAKDDEKLYNQLTNENAITIAPYWSANIEFTALKELPGEFGASADFELAKKFGKTFYNSSIIPKLVMEEMGYSHSLNHPDYKIIWSGELPGGKLNPFNNSFIYFNVTDLYKNYSTIDDFDGSELQYYAFKNYKWNRQGISALRSCQINPYIVLKLNNSTDNSYDYYFIKTNLEFIEEPLPQAEITASWDKTFLYPVVNDFGWVDLLQLSYSKPNISRIENDPNFEGWGIYIDTAHNDDMFEDATLDSYYDVGIKNNEFYNLEVLLNSIQNKNDETKFTESNYSIDRYIGYYTIINGSRSRISANKLSLHKTLPINNEVNIEWNHDEKGKVRSQDIKCTLSTPCNTFILKSTNSYEIEFDKSSRVKANISDNVKKFNPSYYFEKIYELTPWVYNIHEKNLYNNSTWIDIYITTHSKIRYKFTHPSTSPVIEYIDND